MKLIPNPKHEQQETPAEEKREHKTGREAHPRSKLARKIRKGARKRTRGKKRY